MALPATGPGNPKIVAAAKATWDAAKGKPYKWGGHTVSGFDCSGYVCYVLRQAYPTAGFGFVTAENLFDSPKFMNIDGGPRFGDLIGFRKGPDVTHDHVGIVYDATHWIGSQSSTGVAPVSFHDFYWSPKPHFFRRLTVA